MASSVYAVPPAVGLAGSLRTARLPSRQAALRARCSGKGKPLPTQVLRSSGPQYSGCTQESSPHRYGGRCPPPRVGSSDTAGGRPYLSSASYLSRLRKVLAVPEAVPASSLSTGPYRPSLTGPKGPPASLLGGLAASGGRACARPLEVALKGSQAPGPLGPTPARLKAGLGPLGPRGGSSLLASRPGRRHGRPPQIWPEGQI